MKFVFQSLGAILFSICCSGQTVSHVVVFGVDGLSPRGITAAATPAIHGLIREGASTLKARAVIPTVSSPNWAAMIMGAGPDMTGITSNDWQPNRFEIAPACHDAPGIYPTIFKAVRNGRPGGIGIFTDWPDFVRLVEPDIADRVVKQDGHAAEVMRAALEYLQQKQPVLTFIHLDFVDDAGHQHGWYGPEYDAAVRQADEYLRQLRETLKISRLDQSTIVLLTADHGGHEKKHGSMLMSDVLIPWIAAGPGVAANREIAGAVSTTQTAPTIAAWLGVRPDPCWMARPISLPGGSQQ